MSLYDEQLFCIKQKHELLIHRYGESGCRITKGVNPKIPTLLCSKIHSLILLGVLWVLTMRGLSGKLKGQRKGKTKAFIFFV
jgi:hypothetical protein